MHDPRHPHAAGDEGNPALDHQRAIRRTATPVHLELPRDDVDPLLAVVIVPVKLASVLEL